MSIQSPFKRLNTLHHSIPCDNNFQNLIEFDRVTDQQYLLTPKPVETDPPQFFELNQISTVVSLNSFTAQKAGGRPHAQLRSLVSAVIGSLTLQPICWDSHVTISLNVV